MRIIELPESWRGRAAIVADIEEPEPWFALAELAIVRGFPREKRRREWMASRIAEKIARRCGASGSCVSFSHSGQYGAAAVDAHPIGIDVERIRAIDERAAHLFLDAGEEAAMRRCTIAGRILHFWSAKEALWKKRGGAVPTLKRVPLRLKGEIGNGLRFDGVETYAGDDFVAALTLPIS